jgi:hypothetical protein
LWDILVDRAQSLADGEKHMTISNVQGPLGFVKGIPFTVQQLNGSKARKCVTDSNWAPRRIDLGGTLSAATHADGMILRFVTVGADGKENSLPVNQAEAELISVSEQGEFKIPMRS